MSVEWVHARVEYPLRVTVVYFNSVSLGCRVRILELLSFLGVFWWDSPNLTNTGGYSQLEQPLFLRMSSGVVPKTNLTFCSTPCGQRTHNVDSGGGSGGGVSRLILLGKARDKHAENLNELF